MFLLDQLKFLSDYSGIESANEIHVRHKEIIINDALTFIPGETQDNPLRIAIDLPEFCRIPKAGHITDCNKAESTGVEYDVQRCVTPQLSFLLFRFVAFHYDMKLIYCGVLFLRRFQCKAAKNAKEKEINTALQSIKRQLYGK